MDHDEPQNYPLPPQQILHFFFAKGKNDGTYAPQGKLTELGSLVVDLQKSYNELLSTF